ncbi:amidohydrolase [Phenylobacterium sp.]|uniref:amidohydrolase n=1 Tax=Phenylobacterium sp. TaxID=1871053 RepID=UPI00301CD8A7
MRSGSYAVSAIVLAAAMAFSPAALADPAAINAKFKTSVSRFIDGRIDEWVEIYKDFHAHPELGMEEVRTAGILAKHMRDLGFEVTEGVGNTGVVAIYRNGPGPVVMVRADMDALPMEEKTGLPYASKVVTDWRGAPTPVMHACGHDIHITAWLGAAEALLSLRNQWSGTLMFVAQPAEEGLGGAKAMMDDRIFERFGLPTHAFALHVGPGPWDSVSMTRGTMNSSSGAFEIAFNGAGGHGSRPHTTIDPVMMAARFVVDVQGVISREKDPQQFGVVSVGAIQSGSAGNIIPDTALVRGTIRWYDESVGDRLLAGVQRTAEAIVAMAAAPAADINIRRGSKAVVNDDKLIESTYAAISKVMPGKVTYSGPGTASEDYGEFLRDFKSSVYFGIGGYDPALFADGKAIDPSTTPSNHSPFFAPAPEPTLRTGVTAMTTAVVNVMKRK